MTYKERYLKEQEKYVLYRESWNTLIDRGIQLPDSVWDCLHHEMEEARKKSDAAFAEYLHKEVFE